MADLKHTMNRFYKEVFDNRDIDVIDELAAEDFIEHEKPPPGVELAPGRDGAKQMIGMFLDAFNPFSAQALDQYQDGDTVITRVRFTGTHVGEFAGIPATNRSFEIEGIDIVRFEDGRAVEHWGSMDEMGMMGQLGLLPE